MTAALARTRVLLLTETSDQRGQARVLDWIARTGAELVALVRPEDFRDAHRMVADGTVDLIVTASVADLPGVLVASSTLIAAPVSRPVGEPERPRLVRGGMPAAPKPRWSRANGRC
ncbi:hypothetical protein ACN28G_19815 [Micromonospora sp. WMMA1923]|uniref:hypothetical protein n=1 Tax=Micromonospora sp. WMMA1923 TaxID=3404125 RepID=UPI003B940D38